MKDLNEYKKLLFALDEAKEIIEMQLNRNSELLTSASKIYLDHAIEFEIFNKIDDYYSNANKTLDEYREVIIKQYKFIEHRMKEDYPEEKDALDDLFADFDKPEQVNEIEKAILEKALKYAGILL